MFGHLAAVQEDLENVRAGLGEDDLIHVDLDVGRLGLIFKRKIHLGRLVQQGRAGRIEHLDDLHLKASAAPPTGQNRETGLSVRKLTGEQVRKQPVAVHFAARCWHNRFTEEETFEDRFHR